jgi:hypothetical protein
MNTILYCAPAQERMKCEPFKEETTPKQISRAFKS